LPTSATPLPDGLIPGMDRDGNRLMSMPTTPGIDMGINKPRLFEVAGTRVLVVVAKEVIIWVTVVGFVVTLVIVVGLVVTLVTGLVVVFVVSFVVALVVVFVVSFVVALVVVFVTVLVLAGRVLVFVIVLVLEVTAQSPRKIARQTASKIHLKCAMLR